MLEQCSLLQKQPTISRILLVIFFLETMFRTAITASLLLSLSFAHPTDDLHKSNSTSLEWAPCDLEFPPLDQKAIAAHGETLFCASLPVPLDYTNSESDRTIEIQLIKVKSNKEPFKGSVLTNPGGPGGSGVDWIAVSGPSIRDNLGGHHDVIGFDPR
jgi:hypothetical protein